MSIQPYKKTNTVASKSRESLGNAYRDESEGRK